MDARLGEVAPAPLPSISPSPPATSAEALASSLVDAFFAVREKRDKATHQVMGQSRGPHPLFWSMTVGGTDPVGFGLRSGTGGPGITTSGAGGRYLRALCGRTVLKCWRHCSISTWASLSVLNTSQSSSSSVTAVWAPPCGAGC